MKFVKCWPLFERRAESFKLFDLFSDFAGIYLIDSPKI